MSSDGRFALSGDETGSVRTWMLDWELEEREPTDWDEGARPYLEIFLTQHMPYAGTLPNDRRPTDEEVTLAHTKRGKPAWTDADFQSFLYTLGCAGYGWLRPEGVRKQLEAMAREMPEEGFPLPFKAEARSATGGPDRLTPVNIPTRPPRDAKGDTADREGSLSKLAGAVVRGVLWVVAVSLIAVGFGLGCYGGMLIKSGHTIGLPYGLGGVVILLLGYAMKPR